MSTQQLKQIFANVLEISVEEISDSLAYSQHHKWDSMSHMIIIADIEAQFNVMLDTDDIIDMSSFGKAREILTKYGVTCD